jgi:excisionase family DNA binding protein
MESRQSQAIQDKTLTNFEMRRPPLLVSKRDAAALLSLCLRSIDNLIARKELPFRRIGKRVLIPYSALVAFARRDHPNSPESEGSQETES